MAQVVRRLLRVRDVLGSKSRVDQIYRTLQTTRHCCNLWVCEPWCKARRWAPL